MSITERVKSKATRLVSVFCLALLCASFAAAVSGKAGSSQELRDVLYASYLFAPRAADISATILLALEVILIPALVIPRTRFVALTATIILVSGFFGFHAWRAFERISAPCSCFGPMLRLEPGPSTLLSLVLLVIATSCFNSNYEVSFKNRSLEATS